MKVWPIYRAKCANTDEFAWKCVCVLVEPAINAALLSAQSIQSTKNAMTANEWHHCWAPRQEYLKAGWNISRWQTDKQQQNILCSATIWPWVTSGLTSLSRSCHYRYRRHRVLAHLWGWLRKQDLRYASVRETPHPPACITDLMAPWGAVSFLCSNLFLSFYFSSPPAHGQTVRASSHR